ncbi:MAG TPA: imidazole glycerol phosphate synthase subunit HisH [Terriglobia bacterium]|jgi:imidazole glycerol phosphate synthase glutamine amidotransferase subunit|nr:imidazole glycerol phosphate synthase subunit HisH [Terriglobia bacterium]
MIALLDYGAGNVGSVLKAVQHLGYAAQPVDRSELLSTATKVILPGQGHFGAMIRALEERGLIASLRRIIREGTPFFGICLGLQALYETSEEAPGCFGLGLLPGAVRRFEGIFKVPHIGWSQLTIRSDDGLFRGVEDGSFVYFCHSFYGPPTPEATAVTEYGQTFAAGVERKKVWAVQFHPEKSGAVGLKVLRNFLEL